jgi:hypothetical protein
VGKVKAGSRRLSRSMIVDPNDLWSDGWVKLPRRLVPKAQDRDKGPARKREALVDLWSLANHDDRNGLSRGCCDPSIDFLAERWNWNRSKVVRFLQRLERERFIARLKRPGLARTVTQFLAYDETPKTDTPAIQPAPNGRHTNPQLDSGSSQDVRHESVMSSDTHTGPNRSKRTTLASVKERDRETVCTSCGSVETNATQEVCSRCLRSDQIDHDIEEYFGARMT